MDIKDLRSKEIVELNKLLGDKRKELFEVNMNMAIGKEKSPIKKRSFKKDIAHILTVIREKEIING